MARVCRYVIIQISRDLEGGICEFLFSFGISLCLPLNLTDPEILIANHMDSTVSVNSVGRFWTATETHLQPRYSVFPFDGTIPGK